MNKTSKMTRIALIAAIYAAITFATFYMSFGAIQYRVSEALTILPVFTSAAIPGLSLGCAIANLFGFFIGVNPVGWMDAIFGTLATFLAAISTYYIGKSHSKYVKYLLAPLPAVIFNSVIVGLEITFMTGAFEIGAFMINCALVGIGEIVVCYVLGIPLMMALSRNDLYKKIF